MTSARRVFDYQSASIERDAWLKELAITAVFCSHFFAPPHLDSDSVLASGIGIPHTFVQGALDFPN